MKSQPDIQRELSCLAQVRQSAPRWTRDRQDNWAAIEAQIAVLRNRMSYDSIDHCWPPGLLTYHSRQAALEAIAWMLGNVVQSPSALWLSLS